MKTKPSRKSLLFLTRKQIFQIQNLLLTEWMKKHTRGNMWNRFRKYIYIYIYIYIYGKYKEYIRNIHKYLWYEIIRHTEHSPNEAAAKRLPHWGCRRRRRLCVLCFWSFIPLYYKYLWIFLIYSPYVPYIYILNMIHISTLCVP